MKSVNWVHNVKIRASWGQLGNGSPLGLYPYIPLLTSGLTTNNNLVFNDQRTQAQLNALKFNHRVRKRLKPMRLAPLPVGRFRMLDHMKSWAFRGYQRAVP